MKDKNTFKKATPVLLCLAWCLLIVPHEPVQAANNKKLCNQPWDCEVSCSCSNIQQVFSGKNYCTRMCSESVQNVNKNKCKGTDDENDNCPAETAHNCGKERHLSDSKNVGTAACNNSDYNTSITTCNNNTWNSIDSKACD
ncbi:MAG TPA: hypothetical protein VMX13_06955 [Sedimentisphaerales bacterium]|nr:hypothetical protein [Sedimentisphaerales bacterium]